MASPSLPNKEQVDFPHPPVVVDQLLVEPSSSYVGTYTPVEPGQPYVNLNHSVAQAAKYAGLISLGQKAGKDREFQERFWVSDPATQDIWNYSVSYSGKNNLLPIFTRKYLEKRDDYPALVRANLSTFTGLYAIRMTAFGTGYVSPVVTITDAGGGTGATAIALMDPAGAIKKITLKSEGVNYVTPIVTITDSTGPGAGATAVAIEQPSNCLLTEESAAPAQDPWGALYLEVDRTYESLPGDIFIDIVPEPKFKFPVMTTRQRFPSSAKWTVGQILPIPVNISSASIAVQTVVGLASAPDFIPGEWVVGTGTANTFPSLNGSFLVVAVNGNNVTLDLHVTVVSGAIGGTLKRYSNVFVERRTTDNINVVQKVTTRAAVQDITAYNALNTTESFRPYPFMDALLGINHYKDTSTGTGAGSTYSYSFSWSGGISVRTLPGFRGDCQATMIRAFSMSPFATMPTNPNTGLPYSPTVVMAATGNIVVEGGSTSFSLSDTEETTANSVSFKSFSIPPVLTFPFSGAVEDVGSGNSIANLNYATAIVKDAGSAPRTGFLQGDIITAIDPAEELSQVGVYMVTIWQIVCPYTTGATPANRVFTFTGNAGMGNITVPGILMTDTIAFVANLNDHTNAFSDFEIDISIDNTVTQTSGSDFSGFHFLIGVL